MVGTEAKSKPLIFISHATFDKAIAKLLETRLKQRNILATDVEVFVSSISGKIGAGDDWFDTIRARLAQTEIAIFLLTPASINRPWVWFEMGAFWDRHKLDNRMLIPVRVNLEEHELPVPWINLQCPSLTDVEQVAAFFNQLTTHLRLTEPTRTVAKDFVKALKKLDPPEANRIEAMLSPTQRDLYDVLRRLVASQSIPKAELDIFAANKLLPLIALEDLKQRYEKPERTS